MKCLMYCAAEEKKNTPKKKKISGDFKLTASANLWHANAHVGNSGGREDDLQDAGWRALAPMSRPVARTIRVEEADPPTHPSYVSALATHDILGRH
ncbi:uncharacterized protein UV8b_03673 [Ustilaginoidea virens]|uniref:Uncharacterized protein n=1 Tax=Ustilaginoidea virens TaxID=1159556 RepID=A0A8E5MHC0_USTVR|nr:uncharacterized protein UV8b_03673 [Ustilaginoidea virens]QUC19432.1 hypothetical protein UV8b_03673 [Ustilaginoidea virens]